MSIKPEMMAEIAVDARGAIARDDVQVKLGPDDIFDGPMVTVESFGPAFVQWVDVRRDGDQFYVSHATEDDAVTGRRKPVYLRSVAAVVAHLAAVFS